MGEQQRKEEEARQLKIEKQKIREEEEQKREAEETRVREEAERKRQEDLRLQEDLEKERLEQQRLDNLRIEAEKAKAETVEKPAISKPFVPGYVEREDISDSEVENAPESIELSQKEEIKFDKATLIKSINDAASRKSKENPKDDKTSE